MKYFHSCNRAPVSDSSVVISHIGREGSSKAMPIAFRCQLILINTARARREAASPDSCSISPTANAVLASGLLPTP